MKDPFGTLAFIVYLIIIAAMAPLGSRGQLVLLFVKAKLFLLVFPAKIHNRSTVHRGSTCIVYNSTAVIDD